MVMIARAECVGTIVDKLSIKTMRAEMLNKPQPLKQDFTPFVVQSVGILYHLIKSTRSQ